VAPDGVAVNAPLSESYIEGLNLRGTEKGFYMSQPNGLLHMSNSFLYASSQGWLVEPDGTIPVSITPSYYLAYGRHMCSPSRALNPKNPKNPKVH
jgi:hypothetical protein